MASNKCEEHHAAWCHMFFFLFPRTWDASHWRQKRVIWPTCRLCSNSGQKSSALPWRYGGKSYNRRQSSHICWCRRLGLIPSAGLSLHRGGSSIVIIITDLQGSRAAIVFISVFRLQLAADGNLMRTDNIHCSQTAHTHPPTPPSSWPCHFWYDKSPKESAEPRDLLPRWRDGASDRRAAKHWQHRCRVLLTSGPYWHLASFFFLFEHVCVKERQKGRERECVLGDMHPCKRLRRRLRQLPTHSSSH